MLTADDQRLDELRDTFRALGSHPGPRPDVAQARYRFHDLVQDYARHLARETDPAGVLLPAQSQVRVSVQR